MKWKCEDCVDVKEPCVLEVELPEIDLVHPENCPFQHEYADWKLAEEPTP